MFDDFDTQICPEELYDPEKEYSEYIRAYLIAKDEDPDMCAKNRAYWGIYG